MDPPPKHLDVKASGACIQETHKTITNKEAVLNGHLTVYIPPPPGLSAEGEAKMSISQSLPERGLFICVL